MIVDELIAILGYDVRGEADRKRFEAGLDKLRTKMRGFATAAVAAGAAAGAALALAGRSVISTGAQFESFAATLETIEGSAEAAQASLDWIAEFGKTTPYDVAQVTDAFVKLKAYGIDPIANDTLRTLGDTASAMGKTLTDAVEMFADASTGEFERLKEFGMRASQEGDRVTFSWTKNGEQLTETVAKNGEDIRRFLTETLGDRFSGAMDRQSRTFNGLVSNLGDTWVDFQRRIGEAGFFDVVKGQLESLLDWAARMDENGSLDRWAKQFSDALTWAANAADAARQHIAQQISTLMEIFENPTIRTAAMGLWLALAAAFAWAFPVITIMVALGLAIDDLISYIGGGESVIGDFIEWMKNLAAAIDSGFDAEQFRKIGDSLAEMIFDGFKWTAARLFANMTWMLRYIWSALTGSSGEKGAGGAAGKIVQWFFDSLKAAWYTYQGLVKGLIKEVAEWFTSTDWKAVGVSIATAIFNGIKSLGANIRAYVSSLLPDLSSVLGGGDEAPTAQQRGGNSHVEGGRAALARETPPAGQRGTAERTRAARDRTTVETKEFSERVTHIREVTGQGAATATVNDQRNQSSQMENHITINQTVTQATSAPTTAATATSRAVGDAMKPQARVQAEGAR